MLARLLNELHLPNPTQVTDVYKARRSRYKNVRIWSFTDLGTGRMQDLFMTDASFNIIKIDRIETIIEDDFNKIMDNQPATAIIDGMKVDRETAEVLEEAPEINEEATIEKPSEEVKEINEEIREEEQLVPQEIDLSALC